MNLVKPLPSIAAGYRHTALLKSDGTVTAVGDNKYGQCDISGWRHPTTWKLVIKK
ncbi:RCC1 domain-containing protein [Paenibacillus sp. FSL P4-0184]|uniref:RCC1-like domain-containing protein n=1 Tax=Paenibacillus sp. FSL P4-0184 TaxID=2921632 RepID=UPI0030F97779